MKVKLMAVWRPELPTEGRWIMPLDGMDLETMLKLKSYLFRQLPFPTPERNSVIEEECEEIPHQTNEQFDKYQAARDANSFLVIGIPVED